MPPIEVKPLRVQKKSSNDARPRAATNPIVSENSAQQVSLGARSYPIHIGDGVLNQPELFTPHIEGRKSLIVTNEVVAPLYLDRLKKTLGNNPSSEVVLPDGEQHKRITTIQEIYDALLAGRFARDCVIIALGGGVIGDMAGFAAATYQRGVDFIQVPTTLLSQVDSSVGGKTGVNHPLGKNMIGAFHQPVAVMIDIATLSTLPQREFKAGLAEVIKYALLGDAEFMTWLEKNMALLLAYDAKALSYAINRCCDNKSRIVAEDEREAGVRALLNLGHTFGHAIENAMGYGEWLHGEAVAAGMCMAADLSTRLGWLSVAERDRAIGLINTVGLPTHLPPSLKSDDFKRLMALDKKVLSGKMRLVLLQGIGNAVVTEDFDHNMLDQTLDFYAG